MRKLMLFILIIALSTLLISCGNREANKPVKNQVALSVPEKSTGEFIGLILDIQRVLTGKGYKLEVMGGQNSVQGQIESIHELLLLEPEFLLIYPVTNYGLEDVIAYADNQGVGVIIIGNEVNVNSNGDILATVKGDHILEGELGAKLLGQWQEDEQKVLNVIEIQGKLGPSNTRDIAKGFREQLIAYQDIEILGVSQDNENRIEAYNHMLEMINRYGDNISAVFAHNDQVGLGAYDAILEAEFDPLDIAIITVGGSDDIRNAILAQQLYGTVYSEDVYGETVWSLIENNTIRNVSEDITFNRYITYSGGGDADGR